MARPFILGLKKSSTSAFSLVEVCLALGIISTSLLSLLGLLPAGLGVLRESMDQTVHAQIVQRIASELVTTDFASLSNEVLFFDQEGQMLDNQSKAAALYSIKIEGADPSLPGVTNADDVGRMEAHLKRIRIGISRSNVLNAPVAWYAIQVAAR
jgi:uncharacterized protein (TIGR02598 family)